MFETTLYKEFEVQVLAVLDEEERIFSASQLLQRAMPELVSTLEAGFGLMAASMQAMHTSHSSEIQKLSKLWSYFFDLGKAHFGNNEENLASSSSYTTSNVASNESDASSIIPALKYTLKRSIMSVTNVWREYSSGLGGVCP